MSTYLDLEILHTFPFSNANRDDSGLPKIVSVGGVTRGRLSSQSLKRAARFYGLDRGEGYDLGSDSNAGYFRTRFLAQAVEDRLVELNADEETIKRVRTEVYGSTAFGKLKAEDKNAKDKTEKGSVLVVVTPEEINQLAQKFLDGPVTPTDIVTILKNSSKRDLALWGRFFASDNSVTLDGAAQVAHAFTTHPVQLESDFFVGLDDLAPLFTDLPGGGHPDDAFYLNGTFYKYANINLDETIANLLNLTFDGKKLNSTSVDSEKTVEEAEAIITQFIKNFALSVPQGKIRSTAHQTLPAYIRVSVREGRPVNSAAAFDEPVNSKEVVKSSINKLGEIHGIYDELLGEPLTSVYWSSEKEVTDEGHGKKVSSLNDLIKETITHVVPVLNSTTEKFLNAEK